MSKINYEEMAKDIYNFCVKYHMWDCCRIYFNNKAWTDSSKWNGKRGTLIAENLYEYNNKDPRDYFEYGNPDTLSFSFEGFAYNIFNHYGEKVFMDANDEFYEMIKGYNCYFELGNSWNLTIIEN